MVRYDVAEPFNAAASYETFLISDLDPDALRLSGGTYDGRYLYFAPSGDNGGTGRIALRYDTMSPFTDSSSWQQLNTQTTMSAGSTTHFDGALFDGAWVYFVPVYWEKPIRFRARSEAWLPEGWNSSFF
jgi:hypothetical protein